MQPAAFSLALIGLGLTGVVIGTTLQLRSFASFCLAAYLVASAEVVALTLALSPLRLVGARGYILGEAVLLVGALLAWERRGRPRPPLPAVDLRSAARGHPILAGLGVAVALAGCYELFIALATPPNNGDSLTYHLTRAAAWLQHGGLYRIPGATTAENDYPANAEIEIVYSLAFLHRDTAAALVQFLAQGALMLAVFGCSRRLGFSRPAALLPALLAPTLSEIALQATTTQNDLVAAALVAITAYFLHSRDRADLWLAGLALGLALGTKYTVLFALPALALIAVASLRGRALLVAVAAAVAGWIAVGSVTYARNVLDSGRPLGALAGDPGLQRPDVTVVGTVSTVARNVHHLIDLPGFPLDHHDLRVPAAAARAVFLAVRIPPNPPESTGYEFGFAINVRSHEDIAFFGPLGVLLVLPLALAFPLLWLRGRARAVHAAHAAALPLYLVALALGYRYSGQGRFLITPVVLTLPLAAAVYRWRTLAAASALVGAVSLFFALAHNEMKPTGLRGTTPVWRLPRSSAQTLQTSALTLVVRVGAVVPEAARLGLVAGQHDADYLLYGPRLRRRLVRLPPGNLLAAADRASLRWIYLGPSSSLPAAAPEWNVERLGGAGALLTRRDQPG